MKTPRSRIFAFLLIFVFALASSITVIQTALGSSPIAGWVNQVHLPLVMNDALSLPTSTPTFTTTSTPTQTDTPTSTPTLTSTSTDTLTPTPTSTSTSTPTLTLTVKQSPLTIWPPIMIYTAQLSYVPSITTAQLKVDFYNLAGTRVEYLGSAPVNQQGQAELSRQMKPGTYTAIARVVINAQVVWSNPVTYQVR